MLIDRIETVRKKTTVYTSVGEFVFDATVLEKYKIGIGTVEGKLFFEAKKESDRILCRRYLYNQINSYEKTKKGYLDTLIGKGYPIAIAEEETNAAEEKGLINDARYAECYFNANPRKGWRRIAAELRAKGVSAETVESFRDEYGDKEDVCVAQAKALWKGLENTYENRRKVYAKLARRGFLPDEIKQALSEIGADEED